MILNNEQTTYKVKGLNFKKFLDYIKRENIEIFNFKKCEYNLLFITIKKSDEKKFYDIATKLNYEVDVKKDTPILHTQKKIKSNLAFFLTIMFICISVVFSCNMVYKVEVYGLEYTTKQEVVNILSKNDITMFKTKSHYDLENIEVLLKTNLDNISFASAIIKGNTLIINVDEKIDNDNLIYDYQPLVAPFDCIIESISLKSGTVVVENGQTVKKGESIVLPYIDYKDGTQLKVQALADIKAYVELSTTTQYIENHTELIRTGKKQTINNFSLFNVNFNKKQTIKFKNYDEVTKVIYPFKNFLIPIKNVQTTYYELKEKNVYIPFEKVKQNIIEQNKKVLYNNLSNDFKEDSEIFSTISYEDNIYFVTTYLKAHISF